MNIAPDVLSDQYQRAHRLWPWLAEVEGRFDLPPYLLFAIGSKETNLNPEYAEGKVHGDGHGWGLFGADDRWNDIALPSFASDPQAQADLAATTLAWQYRNHEDWLDACNAYGPASGRPAYGADVLERRQYLADTAGDQPMPIVDIIRAVVADLDSHGYAVEYEPGWEDRGRPGTFEPQGLVCHHTADRAYGSDYAILSAIRDGIDQGGSWLAGPLAQFGLGRSGTVYVVAAGKANHAGPGGWNGLTGNAIVWGIEAANDGIGEPWPADQLDAYLSLATALARHTGFGPEYICRHAEWSTAGKIDTATAPLNSGAWIRAQVAERLSVDPPTAPPAPDPTEVPDVFIFDGPDGGIFYTDGVTYKRGVPNGDALLPWRLGHVPHLGVVTRDYFDALPDWRPPGGLGLLAEPSLEGSLADYVPEPLDCAGEAD